MLFRTRLIIALAVLIVTLSIFFGIYFGDYEKDVDWNQNSIQTGCTVIEYIYKEGNCGSYKRDINPYVCYTGFIVTKYLNRNATFAIMTSLYEQVSSYLNNDYKINSTIDCWYHVDNINDVTLSLKNTAASLTTSIIFLCTGIIIFMTWIALEIRGRCTQEYTTIN